MSSVQQLGRMVITVILEWKGVRCNLGTKPVVYSSKCSVDNVIPNACYTTAAVHNG